MTNRHEIMGRLVRDPELTRSDDETKNRCNFTVAVDDDYGDGTEFFDCVVWGKRAAAVDKWKKKGDGIFVAGPGHIRSYDGKDGVKRKAYSIYVRDMDLFLPGSKSEGTGKTSGSTDSWQEQEEDMPF